MCVYIYISDFYVYFFSLVEILCSLPFWLYSQNLLLHSSGLYISTNYLHIFILSSSVFNPKFMFVKNKLVL